MQIIVADDAELRKGTGTYLALGAVWLGDLWEGYDG